jgi:hypothetical protein
MNIDYDSRIASVLQTPELVAFWNFQDDSFVSVSPDKTQLEVVKETPRIEEGGIFGPRCARFEAVGVESRGFLRTTALNAPHLSIGGREAQVSVVAWLKRASRSSADGYNGCEFVAGVWNEHRRRQYGMFLNLAIWDSNDQVCAHISGHGGATPGYPYCMDAAIGATKVEFDEWHCAAISYDGSYAKAFLYGVLDVREPQGEAGRNPFYYPEGICAGNADFTIGAVERPVQVIANEDGSFRDVGSALANPFIGCLGGLAIFNRALSHEEMASLAALMA